MKKVFRALLIAAASFATMWVIVAAPPPSMPVEPSPPPEFEFTTLRDHTYSLPDLKGKTILIHFWASWCKPCLIEFPELVALAAAHPDKLEILAISSDESVADIEQFIAEKLERKIETLPKNLHFIHDADKSLTQKTFQTYSYPESYIVDCDYMIKEKVIGLEENWPVKIESYLNQDCDGNMEPVL